MSALALGIVAAVCWGFHDICVRFLSQKTPISACIITVVSAGFIFHLCVMGATGGFEPISSRALWLSLGAGVGFVVATFGLYAAFQRGPVRLVAPLIASYPILSVAWAAWSGSEVGLLQWGAVLLIVCGVGLVAALSDDAIDQSPPKGRTAIYALLSAVGFATTFAFGQAAAEIAHENATTLVTRVFALAICVVILMIAKQKFWPGRKALPILCMMGIADGIALLCVFSAGQVANPEYAAASSSMFGLLTILMAWMFLKERMTLPQWAGCLIAFAGVGYLAI